ncbi:uncharacterized protein LY79DRAFT_573771 [Colletotrichum navitas]|uniref:Uncharacterized protein n=1 Tax=Colletotrichum navitas TaxID=681940 RepID=A0AAD8UY02_9PEZI|nr:uncharacterized protein LY79DRAFT_573771 [Colletotrichum navitas]KAK1564026.1 hypothetical protein LY79DRAFT_573771 [Colletotrichum navitas]
MPRLSCLSVSFSLSKSLASGAFFAQTLPRSLPSPPSCPVKAPGLSSFFFPLPFVLSPIHSFPPSVLLSVSHSLICFFEFLSSLFPPSYQEGGMTWSGAVGSPCLAIPGLLSPSTLSPKRSLNSRSETYGILVSWSRPSQSIHIHTKHSHTDTPRPA